MDEHLRISERLTQHVLLLRMHADLIMAVHVIILSEVCWYKILIQGPYNLKIQIITMVNSNGAQTASMFWLIQTQEQLHSKVRAVDHKYQ